MLNWINDNAILFYILLGTAALALMAIWWNNRKTPYLIACAVVVLLLAGIYLLTAFVVVSHRDQIHNNLREMAAAVGENKPENVAKHLSEEFQYKGITRSNAVQKISGAIRFNQLRDVHVWQIDIETLEPNKGTAHVSFMARPTVGSSQPMFRCESDFVLENGQWRMRTFQLFPPVGEADREIHVPVP
jgi:hypothetical protein